MNTKKITKTPTGTWNMFRGVEKENTNSEHNVTTFIDRTNKQGEKKSQTTHEKEIKLELKEEQETIELTYEGTGTININIEAHPNTTTKIIERFNPQNTKEKDKTEQEQGINIIQNVAINIQENAQVNYVRQNLTSNLQSQVKAEIVENATLNITEVTSKKSHLETTTELNGKEANYQHTSIVASQKPVYIHVTANNNAQYTFSKIIANGVFRNCKSAIIGELHIAPEAHKAQAYQEGRCLLLDSAECNMSPQLFINNNDVQCSHGVSVTQLEKKQLYYLMSRGLEEETAKELLITAHIAKNLPKELEDLLPEITREVITKNKE